MPDREQAVEASGRLDAKLTGANPIDVLIEFPDGASLYDAGDARDDRARCIRSSRSRPASATSGRSRRCAAGCAEKAGITDVAMLKQYVDILPEHLTRRFISAEEDAVVVTGRIPDIDASELLPVIDEPRQGARRRCAPRIRATTIAVTGPVGDRGAQQRRHDRQAQPGADGRDHLRRRLHRPRLPLLRSSCCCRILPGIFPIVLSGTVLWMMGEGLQFASVVALIVSFGLGLSATIHFLNRMRLEDRPGADPAIGGRAGDGAGRPGADPDVGGARLRARRDGALRPAVAPDCSAGSARFAMIAALVADLLILRPTAMFLFRLGHVVRGIASRRKPAE